MDLLKWLILEKLLKIRQSSTRTMSLNRFQGFLKSLDMSRTLDNYEQSIKLKELQVKSYYKQQTIMEISERMIFLIHNCKQELDELNQLKNQDELSQYYINICNNNQDLIGSFIKNFEQATQEYRLISTKIDLVLKDSFVLLLNRILNEQEYLLTRSYLTKIKNRFNNQLAILEDSYKDFKSFLNKKINQLNQDESQCIRKEINFNSIQVNDQNSI